MVVELRSAKLIQRVSGLSKLQETLSQSLDEILESYGDSKFRDSSVSKADFFFECLNLKLEESSRDLLLERCSLSFHKDARSSIEYGLDLVFGWLSEDVILSVLSSKGLEVKLNGEDKFREFLSSSEIGTTSDFQVTSRKETRPLEIIFSWNDYWKNSNKLDLRESKFRKLSKSGQEALCLGIELPTISGFLLDLSISSKDFNFRRNPAWGNKGVYTLEGIQKYMKPLGRLIEELQKS